jgi:hypothetical protein
MLHCDAVEARQLGRPEHTGGLPALLATPAERRAHIEVLGL